MELTNRVWKEFFIEDIFKIKSGKRLTKADMVSGNIPFIGATDSNNGITEFIANKNTSLDKNVLGVNYNGSVVYNFYHSYEAVFSDDVKRLSFKEIEGNKYTFLFVKALILQQKSKYEYGYKFNGERMKRQKILLPINSKGKPDYAFMENYMKQKETELLEKYENYVSLSEQNIKLNSEVEWKEFKIGNVFSVSTGALLPKDILKKGKIARLTATDNNNGIFEFYEPVSHKNYREISNFISISFLGSVFYHPYRASLDMKIHAVQTPNLELNKYIAEFLVFCFKRMASVSSYGNQLSSTDLPKKKILLPINNNGQPDFIYMENYMKALETRKLKQYLQYKKLKTTN
ncbi:restriction endonuclease subunit S [Moheibacter sp.]|uniref:restriction endonuclease subunit S n=1 Tax=Moheibacter sp. TaxID=1965316 RepID=UPI003C721B26